MSVTRAKKDTNVPKPVDPSPSQGRMHMYGIVYSVDRTSSTTKICKPNILETRVEEEALSREIHW
jgi:hypothetical protein